MKTSTNFNSGRLGCNHCNPVDSIDGDCLLMEDSKALYSYGTAFNYLDVIFKDDMIYADVDLYAEEGLHGKTRIKFCPFCGTPLDKVKIWKVRHKCEKD